MNVEQWRQVHRIFYEALDRAPAERAHFIETACAGDLSLRREVETLLASHEEAGSFLETPAARAFRSSSVMMAPGARVGVYEVRSIIGAGGMGEVYRAHDTTLKRDVAIKVLPDVFAQDPERIARFQREAEVLAKLNHPNVAAIYGLEGADGRQALILELVEGPTLADRIAEGPVPLDKALSIARQIAEALEAAHECGVIHRDLKPSNIKITPDGKVKVLDFGLAKVGDGEAVAGANMPNSTGMRTTTPGMIMGTVTYMAPEQARGRAVDERADIWAFGCVLYEMLAGRAPFARDTVTDSLAAILERDPTWTALLATTPVRVQRLLSRCLDKDLGSRLSDIAEARVEIENVLSGVAPTPAEVVVVDRRRAPSGLRWPIVVAASLVALISVAALAWRVLTTQAEPSPTRRNAIASSGAAALRQANVRSLTITPDGARVIYLGGTNSIFVHLLDKDDTKQIYTGGAPLNYFFASSDGQSVGFVEGKTLKRIPITGGAAETIFTAPTGSSGATWAPDDTIIMADMDPKTGLQIVSAKGGDARVLTWPDSAHGEVDHVLPEMLPGGRKVLFTITTVGGSESTRLAVFDLDTTTTTDLMESGSHAHYVPSGHLVYRAGGALLAVGFDPVLLKTSGMPVEVLPRVAMSNAGAGDFDVAASDGTLVYVDASEQKLAKGTMVWVDRKGREEQLLGASAPALTYVHPRLSPDGKQVAVSMPGGDTKGIYIFDIASRKRHQLTVAGGNFVWARDGKRLIFYLPSASDGFTLFSQPADGSLSAEKLGNGNPSGVTLDNRVLVSPGGRDIQLVSLDGTRSVENLLKTDNIERNGVQSPNGQWLAFESNKSGKFEIYMAPFAKPKLNQWPISTDGPNTRPLFSPDGKTLFYVASDGALMEAPLDPHGGRSGEPVPVVRGGRYLNLGAGGSVPNRTYDFDGDRFLMIQPAPNNDPPPQIKIFQNWPEELKRLVPAKH